MSGCPLVSIGLPVYNGGRFLQATLESLVAQTYRPLEILVSDNGSTDDTEAICRAAAQRHSCIKYHRSDQNRGSVWNYRRTFQLSSGKYFKWAAHDDLCAPSLVEKCLAVMEREPDVVLAYARARIIDEHGEALWDHWQDVALPHDRPHRRLRHLVWNLGGMGNPVFGLLRSRVLARTRGLGVFLSHDYVLLAELALLGKFAEVPEFLFFRRLHTQSSRAAPEADEEAAEWFDPDYRPDVALEYWTVFLEHLRGIRHVPLGWRDRLLTLLTFPVDWIRVWHRQLAEEVLRLLRHTATRVGRTIRGQHIIPDSEVS